MTPSIYR